MPDSESQNISEIHILRYWNVLVQRRKLIGVFTILLVLSAVVGSLVSPKTYRSSAYLQIFPTAPAVFDEGIVSEQTPTSQWAHTLKTYYATQYRIMQSRSVLEAAIQTLREDHDIHDFDDAANPSAMLKAHLEVVPDNDTQLVRVVVEYDDPEKAALIANTVAQSYIDFKLSQSFEDSKLAMSWLREQLDVYRTRKIATDEEVHRYRFDNALVSPETGSHTTIETLEKIQEAWSDAHVARQRAQYEYDSLVELTRDGDLLVVAVYLSRQSKVLEDALVHHEELEQERTRLLSRVTAKHPDVERIDKELRGLESQIGQSVTRIVQSHKANLDILTGEEAGLERSVSAAQAEVQGLGETLVAFELLKSEAQRNERFYTDLDTRLTEVGIGQFIQASNVRLIEEALPKPQPVRPRLLVNAFTAMLLGLLGGGALSLVLDFFDVTLRNREDIEQYLGVPFLGFVPRVGAEALAEARESGSIVTVHGLPRSALAECMRTVRTNTLFGLANRHSARLLITSVRPQEGKTFMSANLSTILAMGNRRVLLIDGDTRRPSLHEKFEVDVSPGLLDVLVGNARLDDVKRSGGVPGLDLVTAGRSEQSPGELIKPELLAEVLEQAQGYDLIVIDSPPVQHVSDALVFAAICDGIVLVAEEGQTSRKSASEVIERLRAVNRNIIGTVINKTGEHTTQYSYYYQDGYGPPESSKPRRSGAGA